MKLSRTILLFIFTCSFQFRVNAQHDPIQAERDQITTDSIFWSKVMSIPDIQQIDTSGIYLETIQEGTGESPTADNEVLLYFSIEDNRGVLLLSNLRDEKPGQIYLGNTSLSWRKGFSVLQKGGKYRLFIPKEAEQSSSRTGGICVYVELIDFGPNGTRLLKE